MRASLYCLLAIFAFIQLKAQNINSESDFCAIPPAPYPIEIKQPDGTTVQVVAQGRPDHFWQETPDGYTIMKNKQGYYEYATTMLGKLLPSGLRVNPAPGQSAASPAMLGIKKHLQPTRKKQVLSAGPANPIATEQVNAAGGKVGPMPNKGNLRVLLILIDYPDAPHVKTKEEIQALFNDRRGVQGELGQSPGFAEYLEAASFSQLNVTVDVTDWYTADQSWSWYGHKNGWSRAQSLIMEAIRKADSKINYANYDNDKDGNVDGIMVMHAGPGAEEGGQTAYIWSHRWVTSDYMHLDGVRLWDYCTGPETRWGGRLVDTGIWAHEFGHLLGLPDLYSQTASRGTIGNWCLMASGNWNNSGYNPADFSAWCKERLGWVSSKNITGKHGSYSLSPSTKAGGVHHINTPDPDEYFLLEYRKKQGIDSHLPGEGLAIWHINKGNRSGMYYDKLVDLEEADGDNAMDYGQRGDWGDLYPNTHYENNSFDFNSTPNSDNIVDPAQRKYSGVAIQQITRGDEQVTYTYREAYPNTGEDCENGDLAILGENKTTHATHYYSFTVPFSGTLLLGSYNHNYAPIFYRIALDCEKLRTNQVLADGSFQMGEYRPTRLEKGQQIVIEIKDSRSSDSYEFPWTLSIESGVTDQDSLALVDFYNTFLGEEFWSTKWLKEPVAHWEGVQVRNGRVISLSANFMKGGFMPESFFSLDKLQRIDFFTDVVGSVVEGNWDNIIRFNELTFLHLIGNFQTTILNNVPKLFLLNHLYLEGGHHGKSLPDDFGAIMQNLNSLTITNAGLEGSIPSTLGEAVFIEEINFSGNKLTGPLPASLAKNPILRGLQLSKNQLSGSIPEELIANTSLQTLILSNNAFTRLPDNLLNYQRLSNIDLSYNQINNFPANLSEEFLALGTLDLSHNKITGSLPQNLQQRSFNIFKISHNQLTGTLPAFNIYLEADISHNLFSDMEPVFLEETWQGSMLAMHNRFSFGPLYANSGMMLCWLCERNDEEWDFYYNIRPQDTLQINVNTHANLGDTVRLTTFDQDSERFDNEQIYNTYYWFRDGEPVDTVERDNSLLLEGVEEKDFGRYHVVVTNSFFSDKGGEATPAMEIVYDHIMLLTADTLPQTRITVEPVAEKTYGDPTFNIEHSNSAVLPATLAVLEGYVSLKDNEVSIQGAGQVRIQISVKGNEQYKGADTIISFMVKKAPQTLTVITPEDTYISTSAIMLEGSSSASLPITYKIKGGTAAIIEDSLYFEEPGKITVEASQSGNSNYLAAESKTFSFNVLKDKQQLTFRAIPDKVYGMPEFNLEASSDQSLPVTFKVKKGKISIKDKTVTIEGAGEAVIEAIQSGNHLIEAALSVERNFTIAKAKQSIFLDTLANKPVGYRPDTIYAYASSKLPVSIKVVEGEELVSLKGNMLTALHAAGNVIIEARQDGNENYEAAEPVLEAFAIYNPQKKDQVIRVTHEIPDNPALETSYSFNVSASSGLSPHVEILGPAVLEEGKLQLKGREKVEITITQAGDETYNPAPAWRGSFRVAKSAQQIKAEAIPEEVIFSEQPLLLQATATSDLPVTVEILEGPVNVKGMQLYMLDTGKVTLELSQSGNEEYGAAEVVIISFKIVMESVVPPVKEKQTLTIEAALENITYGDGTVPLAVTTSSGLPLDFTIEGPIALDANDWLVILGAGEASIHIEQKGDERYEPVDTTLSFVIAKASQTVTLELLSLDEATFLVQAAASSGLPVTIELDNGDAILEKDTLRARSSGKITVIAYQEGNEKYHPSEELQKSIEVNLVTGVADALDINYRLYPNPAEEQVIMQATQDMHTPVYLLDSQGKMLGKYMWKGRTQILPLEKFTSGTYFLHFQDQKGRWYLLSLIIP